MTFLVGGINLSHAQHNQTHETMSNVTVVGIGAMGGGMARALLQSPSNSRVVGYDQSTDLVNAFQEEAKAAGKATDSVPTSLQQAIPPDTQFVVIVLVNEQQCEQVCFSTDEDNLLSLMPDGSCVILCSTVTATWARAARVKFQARGVHFVDCPVSGGPSRAKLGDLTMMASGDEESLAMAKPLLDAMGRDIFIIEGGAGMGSTVKMVHQLLAGVHIVCAAEALALAAKAGLDVEQMYNIVNGAAGASWMFTDRGKRMITGGDDVMSALNIFIKDLDIVYSEAKALQSPIPVASAALQQFIAGQSLGLGLKDDSQIVKVYENVTGVPVAKSTNAAKIEGDEIGDVWKMEDGMEEEILEVGKEPRHVTVIDNEYVRALRVSFPPGDTTFAHRHAEDSLYFFLVEGGIDIVNHVKGNEPQCDCCEFGEVRYGTHKSDKPLVHKITNKSDKQLLCIDAEVLKRPPVVAAIPLVAEKHELIKTRDKCRVYKLSLAPGESVEVSYPFFYFLVVLRPSTVKTEIGGNGGANGVSWEETKNVGDVQWKEPVTGLKQTNVSSTLYEAFVAEWR